MRQGGDDGSVRPLASSLSAVSGANGWLRVVPHPPDEPGWTACSELLADVSLLASWVSQVEAELTRAEGQPPPPVTPVTYVMGWYLQVPATVAALLFTWHRRVPDLSPEALAVHRAPFGYVDAVAVTARHFTCLPDDPAAASPDATVVDDDTALARTLREGVVEHARAFHRAFRPGVKIGSRQRWGMVLDVLDTALWQAGRAAGDEARGVGDARLVLDGPRAPLTEGSRLRRVPRVVGGRDPAWERTRVSCCFMFALPSGDVCTSCPRRTTAPP